MFPKDVYDIGLKGRLPLFLQNFLSDREFKVKVGSTLSELHNQEQGVPQGSILSVTLFSLKTRTVRGSDYSPAIELSEQKGKLVTELETLKNILKNKLSLVKFCLLFLKILSGNEILTSIKGRNSVANVRHLTLYNPNINIINVNVHTKFG